jgi:hypothetical protein
MDQIAYSKSEPMLAYNSKDSQYKYCLCNNQFISYLFNKQIIDKEEITFDCLLDNALPYIKQLTSINKSKEEEPAPYSTKKNKLFMLLKSCTEKKIGLDARWPSRRLDRCVHCHRHHARPQFAEAGDAQWLASPRPSIFCCRSRYCSRSSLCSLPNVEGTRCRRKGTSA